MRASRRDDQGRGIPTATYGSHASGSTLGPNPGGRFFGGHGGPQVNSTESTTMSESSIGYELVCKPIQDQWRVLDRHGRRLDETYFERATRFIDNAADDLFNTLISYTPWSPEPTLTFSYNGQEQRICKRNYHRRLIQTLTRIVADRATEMTCLDIRRDEDDHYWYCKEAMLAAGWYYAMNVQQIGTMSLLSVVKDSPKYMLAVKHGDLTELDIRTICDLPEMINAWHTVTTGIKPCVDELLQSAVAA